MRREVLVSPAKKGRVTIICTNGMLYTDNVGTFGAVSAGGNWDRIDIASHRCAMSLVPDGEFCTFLLSDDTLVRAENESPSAYSPLVTFPLLILRYQLGENTFRANHDLVWLGFSVNFDASKMRSL